MFAVKHKFIFFILSSVLAVFSVGAVAVFGLNFGVEFTGGTLTEFSYTTDLPAAPARAEHAGGSDTPQAGRPAAETLEGNLNQLGIGGYSLRSAGDTGYILRTRELTDAERSAITAALTTPDAEPVIERFTSIGPTIGSELATKAIIALLLVAIAIVLFIAYVFRRVSKPVASWKYGVIAIITLLHDVLIPVGAFALLGYFLGAEIDVLFVVALLTILGYSVNDTIVVFDRVRENLKENQERKSKEPFELVVGKSLNQTYTRSINTSLTTVLVLLALFFFGGVATQNFALTLIIGIIAGTYSSVFLASPLLVVAARWVGKPSE